MFLLCKIHIFNPRKEVRMNRVSRPATCGQVFVCVCIERCSQGFDLVIKRVFFLFVLQSHAYTIRGVQRPSEKYVAVILSKTVIGLHNLRCAYLFGNILHVPLIFSPRVTRLQTDADARRCFSIFGPEKISFHLSRSKNKRP